MPGARVPESDVIMIVLILHIIMIRHMYAGCAGAWIRCTVSCRVPESDGPYDVQQDTSGICSPEPHAHTQGCTRGRLSLRSCARICPRSPGK